jgi:hypothetical protein
MPSSGILPRVPLVRTSASLERIVSIIRVISGELGRTLTATSNRSTLWRNTYIHTHSWSLTLRAEHRLRVYVNRVLRRIFGSKKDEVTGGWRKLHNEELRHLCSSPGHLTRMGGTGTFVGYWWESHMETRHAGLPPTIVGRFQFRAILMHSERVLPQKLNFVLYMAHFSWNLILEVYGFAFNFPSVTLAAQSTVCVVYCSPTPLRGGGGALAFYVIHSAAHVFVSYFSLSKGRVEIWSNAPSIVKWAECINFADKRRPLGRYSSATECVYAGSTYVLKWLTDWSWVSHRRRPFPLRNHMLSALGLMLSIACLVRAVQDIPSFHSAQIDSGF